MSNALVSIGSSIRQRLTAPANPNCRYRSSRKLSSNSPESLRRAWGALVASRRNSRHWRGFRHALRQEDGARDARHARLPGADRIQWPGRRDRAAANPDLVLVLMDSLMPVMDGAGRGARDRRRRGARHTRAHRRAHRQRDARRPRGLRGRGNGRRSREAVLVNGAAHDDRPLDRQAGRRAHRLNPAARAGRSSAARAPR